MTPRQTMEARLRALQAESLALYEQRGALIDKATSEQRGMTPEEDAQYKDLTARRNAKEADIGPVEERLRELIEQEQRQAAAEAGRVETGDGGEQRTTPVHVTAEAPVYAEGKVETSYFRDLFNARQNNDRASIERLVRNDKQRADQIEKRALGNTGAAGGSGGEFAPPLWLIDEFIALARPGRKFADSLNPRPLPAGVASINLPRVTGGTTTAIQTTQNSALSQTDMTTASISATIATIGGKQVVSLQLLEQSGIPFDEVVLQDLAADYAKQISVQALSGSNAGGQLNGVYTYFNASGTVNITYTQATPAVGGAGGLYSKIFAAASAIETARFMPPDTIWMHPRRWNWILSSSDANNRPLVVPSAYAQNPVGVSTGVGNAQGVVGQIGGLDVITDPAIPTNLGAGTNQDPVLVGLRGDLRMWESALKAETFMEPYADSMGVLFRVYAYAALMPNRYTTSLAVVNGTGLVTPAF